MNLLWSEKSTGKTVLFCNITKEIFIYFVVDLPENAVKGVLKYLVQSIGTYQDAKSRRAVLKILQIISKTFPTVVVKNLATVLNQKATSQTKIVNAR